MNIDSKKTKPTVNERYNEINRYTSLMLVFACVFNAFGLLLNEVGVFTVEKNLFRVCVLINLAFALTPYLLTRFTNLGGRRWVAYFIITCANAIQITSIVCLGFNGVLVSIFPILIAITYYSRKMIVYGIVMSGFSSILASYLCGKFSNIAQFFAYNTVYVYAPETIKNTELVQPQYIDGRWNILTGMMIEYALPNCIIICCLYMVVRRIVVIRVGRKEANDERIYLLKNQVLTSMSDIVENRDGNTGGHVKRTTDVVEILVDNLDIPIPDKDGKYKEYVIKAAATHDLGKIAIDDDILKKPGRLTPEEFEQIKIHPVKSEELINQVLGPIEDADFMVVARNLAKYHHERYDGKGYPEGLSGDNIPLEARIMAIADVYDALVSKRCYKEPISHADACKIIKESMGTQFDPKLLNTFEKSMDRLEAYYAM